MKKKIGLLLIFVVSLVATLFSINGKNVKAETNNCVTKTNYYLFMSAPDISWYNEQFANSQDGTATMTTSKTFKLVDHKNEGVTILNEGAVSISKTSTDSIKSMSLETFHEIYLELEDDKIYTNDDGITEYIRAETWYDQNEIEKPGDQTGNVYGMPVDYDAFVNAVPNNLSKANFYEPSTNSTSITFKISRTWDEEDVAGMTGTILSPAAYYIQYQECNGSVTVKYLDTDTEEEIMDSHLLDLDGKNDYSYTCPSSVGSEYVLDESKETEFSGEVNGDIVLPCYYKKNTGYKVTVHFREKGTKNKIKDSTVILTDLADKASYEYTCKNDISLYDLDTKTKLVGKIDGENVDLYCDYTKKKMTLTVDYGTDYNCTDAGAIRKSESVDHVWGAKVDYTIPKIDGYEFSELGTSSKKIESGVKLNAKETAFSLTMPSKNASICLVYIKNSKTGSGWIYLAWIIGIGALAYSIYYFTRYFNNEEV